MDFLITKIRQHEFTVNTIKDHPQGVTKQLEKSRTCDTKDFLKAGAAECPEHGALFLEVYFRKVRKSSQSDEAQ